MNFEIVLGVDEDHLEHLRNVLVSWAMRKPSLLKHKFVVFYHGKDLAPDVQRIMRAHGLTSQLVPWDPPCTYQLSEGGERWYKPQRQLMLSGFVYVAAEMVKTPYWLKLDLDVVASGHDSWVDDSWFDSNPAIVGHRWGYTKPADQMLKLDEWAGEWLGGGPLNLAPEEGSSLVSHKRIISWCAFFNTRFTRDCADVAAYREGYGRLPVPSQDGYLWYMAARQGLPILRENMKARGWIHRSKLSAVKEEVQKQCQSFT